MSKKFSSELRRYSYIILPSIIMLMCWFLDKNFSLLSDIKSETVSSVAGISGDIIGLFLTIFTIYVAFPSENITIKRLRKSGHGKIFTMNIWIGVGLSIVCIFSWLFNISDKASIIFFASSFGNIVTAMYYIATIGSYLQT